MGSKESELCVIRTGRCPVSINGKLVATIMDHKPFVNIKPFGQCQSLANPTVAAATSANYGRLQKMPCVPNIVAPWIGGKMRALISGEPVLLDNSKQTCMWAGMIEITNPGQDFVMEGAEPLNANNSKVESEKKAKAAVVAAGSAEESEEEAEAVTENGEASEEEEKEEEKEEAKKLTVKDFVEILEKIEAKQGYEAARHYASNHIDYWNINKLTESFVKGDNDNADNDPNIMPTRFMILYGADDNKRSEIDDYPDSFGDEPDHKMSVKKLREALIIFGNYNLEKTGPFDDDVYFAFMQYLRQYNRVDLDRNFADDEFYEDTKSEHFAKEHGVFTWKYFEDHDCDHDSIVEELNPEYGDELLTEKGANLQDYLPGVSYHYPCVPFRAAIDLGGEYQGQEVKYVIINCEKMTLVDEGTLHG